MFIQLLCILYQAIEQSSVLAEVAYQAGERFGINVFVTVRPDLTPKLNHSANGMQVALINVLDKVHNVKLPVLEKTKK